MDPLEIIPPFSAGLPTPAPAARVQRADRDEQHLPPREDKSSKRQDDQSADEDDVEDFYEESERPPAGAHPPAAEARIERRGAQALGPHIDIIA